MPKTVEPQVFLIAKTAPDQTEMRSWLDFIGASEFALPPEEAATIGNLLITLAGKRCYKSFQPGLNPNVSKVRTDLTAFIDNILKVGHGCYDQQTEVLTKRGWVSWLYASKEDEYATLSEDGDLEWHKPSRMIRYEYSGKMYKVNSSQVDLLVTPDHKMLVCPSKEDGNDFNNYKLIGAKDLENLETPATYIKTLPSQSQFSFAIGFGQWVNNWTGTVYCAEVPNNTLFVRRNGKAVWSGNSVIEHVNYTFAIENVSRVFTAEFNRHRAGLAVSEGSMRYIRFDDLAYWIPESYKAVTWKTTALSLGYSEADIKAFKDETFGDAPTNSDMDKQHIEHLENERAKYETRKVFHKAFTQMEENYQALLNIWDYSSLSNFSDKKKLTSLFRRLIGMGVATGGVWTGNLRALRHIFTMRCDPAAEEEICYVASMMLERMIEAEPDVFGDFHKENGYWKPKYLKV